MATARLGSFSHVTVVKAATKKSSCFVAAALLNQQQEQQQEMKRKGKRDGSKLSSKSSPLLVAEEVATRFGHDVAVADLEHLFGRASFPGGDPPAEEAWGPSGRRPLRVAYQGGRGSYCQEAATRAFKGRTYDSFPCSNMEDAFYALEDRSADQAIVPAENSVDGPIDRNLDLLLRHHDVNIVGELVVPVNHCLLSVSNSRVSQIRRVVSHPQALSHCRARLSELGLEIDEVDSVADAAMFVADNQISDTAVIGSEMAAREFGLAVLEQNLQDPTTVNYNRFLQLGLIGSSSGIQPGDTQKTTVAFTLEKGVSDLFQAMHMFEAWGVKITRVEHRPNRANPIRLAEKRTGKVMYLDYVFVFDLEGNGSDPKVQSALVGLKDVADFVRVLGSYTSKCE